MAIGISNNRHAFTLVEAIASIVVLSIVAAIASPIIVAASESFADSSNVRTASAEASMAMDRITRAIREAPESGGVPDITTADTDTIAFGDGTRIELIGTSLWLTTPLQAASPLCQEVSAFELTYIGADGLTLNFGGGDTPAETQCLHIRLASDGFELRTAAFMRVRMAS